MNSVTSSSTGTTKHGTVKPLLKTEVSEDSA